MATASKSSDRCPNEGLLTKNALPKDVLLRMRSTAASVEIFDQVTTAGSDASYIIELAEYVDGKMRAVSEQTATVDSVRLRCCGAQYRRRIPSPEAETGCLRPKRGSAPANWQPR